MSVQEQSPPLLAPRLAAALVVVSAVSLLLYAVLTAYAPDLRSETSSDANVLSNSAVGFAGMRQLLESWGIDFRLGREPPPANTYSLVVLTPSPYSAPSEVARLSSLGQRLIVLPKWNTIPDPTHSGWVVKSGAVNKDALVSLLSDIAKGVTITQSPGLVPTHLTAKYAQFQQVIPAEPLYIDTVQTISGKTLEPDIVDGKGQAVLAHVSGTQIYILSEPDLLNNLGLRDIAAAHFSVALVGALRVTDRPVSFDITLNGFGSTPDILRAAFSPPLLGATLCAILAASLIAFHAFSRFGAPDRRDRTFAFGKRALADNTAAVIRLMRREPNMAARYAETTLNIVATQAGIARKDVAPSAWLERLEQHSGVEDRFSDLSKQARQVQDTSAMLQVAQRLYRWRRGILHEQ